MSQERVRVRVRAAMSVSAVCLGALGGLLLFAPEEASRMLGGDGAPDPLVPLLGAGLLGFAAMNWIARGSVLGGIYGRAVVAGNQTHLTIGTLALLQRALRGGGDHPVLLVVTAAYLVGAGLFAWLTFFSPGTQAD